ncbi:hypothetical protein N7532_010658 [Penicillium argentinense]|uniref:Uncharacterized protein n=1 Tax=Penicillium argentinense TaxID=1131581 RepID=A0A9W9EQ03_9EURO|nr:uncharacterized protein N7532_010658 [Penicillium argentinense]KAJ5085887.1 hypothetical protein N7532_010658 [Penicillium argentinense]
MQALGVMSPLLPREPASEDASDWAWASNGGWIREEQAPTDQNVNLARLPRGRSNEKQRRRLRDGDGGAEP